MAVAVMGRGRGNSDVVVGGLERVSRKLSCNHPLCLHYRLSSSVCISGAEVHMSTNNTYRTCGGPVVVNGCAA